MRKYLIVLFMLLCVMARAQTLVEYDWDISVGSTASKTTRFASSEQAALVNVLARTGVNGRLLGAALQPTISRTGNSVIVSFSASKVGLLPNPFAVELSINGTVQVRYICRIVSSSTPTPPGSGTTTTPSTGTTPTVGNIPNFVPRFYDVVSAPSGRVLNHDQKSTVVTGQCYVVTYDSIGNPILAEDNLWTVQAIDQNNAVLRGPPSETFSGRVFIQVYTTQSNQ